MCALQQRPRARAETLRPSQDSGAARPARTRRACRARGQGSGPQPEAPPWLGGCLACRKAKRGPGQDLREQPLALEELAGVGQDRRKQPP